MYKIKESLNSIITRIKELANNMDDKTKKYVKYTAFLLDIVIFFIGICTSIYNVTLISILFLYSTCIYFSIKKNNIFLLLLYMVLFVFILSRPTISMLRGNIWWHFNRESVIWSLVGIYISLICIHCGSILGIRLNQTNSSNKTNQIQEYIEKNKDLIAKISFILFIMSYIFSFIIEINKLIVMRGKEYEKFYTEYTNNFPAIFNLIAGMLICSMMIYLLTLPNKKKTYITLIMYTVLRIPMLIIGERGTIVVAIIFSFLYIYYRNMRENCKWINKKIKIFIVIMIPISIISLGAYNYLRSDEEVPSFNPIDIAVDFFYKQGVSYDVLNIGYNALDKLPNKENKNYTFGGFIDYFKYNKISQFIFKTKDFEGGNNIRRATESNSFAHAMSYVTRGQEYLDGHGWGSSYLLETYADFGYIGIILYSILLGILMSNITKLINRFDLLSLICMEMLVKIYMVPRAEALGFLKFIVEVSFWMPIVIVFLALYVINKIKGNKEIETKELT